MFSKWLESAKDSASQFLAASKTVLQDSVNTIQSVSNDLNDKANAFIREKMTVKPDDITYITQNIIAMGFPGNPKTHIVDTQVNKCDMIAYYLEARHKDHYMLFNLAEETYDTFLFHDQVVNYDFTGYPAPPLGLLIKICTNIETWIKKDPENVAVIHCYDGKGRTMTICACVLSWLGSFHSPAEALAICLDRRGLSEDVMVPSQMRCIQNFDNLMQGVRPVGDAFVLSSLTIHSLPAMENETCSPFIEVYNQNELIYSSYRKGSKTKGTIQPLPAGETVTFTPNITLYGNVFVRCRHLPDGSDRPVTLFRFQFYTGFIKLFKFDLQCSEVDPSLSLPADLKVECTFTPGTKEGIQQEDPYEALIIKESSSLWSEVMKKKEARMNEKDIKENTFVVGATRTTKRDSVKSEEKMDYVNELKKLENELSTTVETHEIVVEEDAMNLDKLIENFDDMEMESIDNFNLKDYEDILKSEEVQTDVQKLLAFSHIWSLQTNMNCKILIFLAISILSIAQELSERNSLSPPFNNYGWSGNRRLVGWNCGGDASIREYFIRLTPDRQSKAGYCWNDHAIKSNKWVTTVKFRISGQGEALFGDGMTIFFSNKAYHEKGTMHGTNDVFQGFAIDLSTFRNPSFLRFHRDVGLYVGNNTMDSVFKPDQYHPGCLTNYRYHEKRQDFNVDSSALLQISYDGDTGRVKVQVDESGRGVLNACIDEVISLPQDWWKNAHIGVSASTGDLADNHDIIEINTYTGVSELPAIDEKVLEKKLEKEKTSQLTTMLQNENIDITKLNPKERAFFALVKELYDRQTLQLAQIKRELEHSMAAIDDNINNMIRKLQKRGDVSDVRITDLESSLQKRVGGSIASQVQQRITVLEKMLEENLKQEVKKKSGAWVVPFILLAVCLVFVFSYAYKQYKRLQKTHML